MLTRSRSPSSISGCLHQEWGQRLRRGNHERLPEYRESGDLHRRQACGQEGFHQGCEGNCQAAQDFHQGPAYQKKAEKNTTDADAAAKESKPKKERRIRRRRSRTLLIWIRWLTPSTIPTTPTPSNMGKNPLASKLVGSFM